MTPANALTIGWLDNNQEEQYKLKELLSLLREKGTLDQLGIGTIRDAFSNLLFPGITTNQTRAKYLVILLYIFQEAYDEAKTRLQHGADRYSFQQIIRNIDKKQDDLVPYFKRNEEGVIGKRSINVVRKPRFIYWSALRTFHMVNPNLTFPQMCKNIREKAFNMANYINEVKKNRSKKKKKLIEVVSDDYKDDQDAFIDSDLIFCPPNWNHDQWSKSIRSKSITMQLTPEEASFIKLHILNPPKSNDVEQDQLLRDSALAQLLRYYSENNVECEFETFDQIPYTFFDDRMRNIYQCAKEFRHFIFGAHLAYYYLVSKQTNRHLRKAYNNWKQQDFNAVDLTKMLEPVKQSVNKNQWIFLNDILKYAREGRWDKFESRILEREKERLKGRNRSAKAEDADSVFDSLDSTDRIKLDYRAHRAGVILRDILNGLSYQEL